jgi:Putative addiction module component
MTSGGDMAITIPLEKMSVEEKIQTMETIWDDLCARAANMASPPWHGEVLAEREAAIKRGEDTFEDWETAKRNIKKEIP